MGRSDPTFATDWQKFCSNYRATLGTPQVHGHGAAVLQFADTNAVTASIPLLTLT